MKRTWALFRLAGCGIGEVPDDRVRGTVRAGSTPLGVVAHFHDIGDAVSTVMGDGYSVDFELRAPEELISSPLYIHPPEDILLQKLRWYRIGGEVSDRQWRDVLGIIRVQGPRLDRAYLSESAPALGVADLLTRALNEAAQ